MSQRKAVTKAIATRYRRAGKAEKGRIPRRVVCDDGLASQPCPQGPDLRQRVSRTWCDVRFFFELCSAKSV